MYIYIYIYIGVQAGPTPSNYGTSSSISNLLAKSPGPKLQTPHELRTKVRLGVGCRGFEGAHLRNRHYDFNPPPICCFITSLKVPIP